jgi:hypothetical protein
VIRKRVERKSAESAGPKEMPPVHGASALIAVWQRSYGEIVKRC